MKIYAHRGASGYAPENTMLSFETALTMHADGIELDVHYSKDGKLVVLHDFDLSRTTDMKGYVFEHTYEELSLARCRMPGGEFTKEGIPLLADVLKLVSKAGIGVYIELKAGSFFYQGIEARVIEEFKKARLEYEQTLFASFDHESLKRIKVSDKHCITGALTSCRLFEAEKYLNNIPCEEYCAEYISLDSAYTADLSNNGITINCYTPNTLTDYKFVAGLKKIDKMVTNYPDRALDFFQKNPIE